MKRLLFFVLLLTFLNGCASQPLNTDTGKPGQIKVVVFYDDNKNGVMDAGESGAQSRVAISQELSCPPAGDPNWVDTDPSGIHVFQDLKPGKYCVFPLGAVSYTTKMTQEAYVSSDQVATVAFGMERP